MNGHAMYEQVRATGGDDLVLSHAPLVKRIAHHLMSRLPPSVQVEDLIQAGMIGLLEASRHYDAGQGASFQTYAGIRIRGAMLDEIRRLDWTPRSVHRKARDVSEAIHQLENHLGREPRDTEVAGHLGMSLADYHDVLRDAATAKVFSIDYADPERGEAPEPAGDEPPPLSRVEDAGFHDALADAIRALPEREQLVMSLYYDDELNLREIGEVLGVTESRISQIHSRIMLKLRAHLADWVTE